jgi:putative methyltransferase (TIGR04325 family)
MKRYLKLFIPPIFLKVFKYLNRNSKYDGITYHGIYNSFNEVFSNYSFSTRYNSKESTRETLKKSTIKVQKLKNNDIPTIDWNNSRLNLFTSFVSTFPPEEKIHVLDIGGGLAESFIDLKFSCPHLKLHYYVYELPEITEAGKDLEREFPNELKFITDFKDLKTDIILFGSSLQYFENYKEIVNDVCSLKPKHILLTDHPMGNVNTFVCAQVNMKDRVIPRYVFNLDEIEVLFSKNNYYQSLKSVNYYPFHNFNNYDGEYKKCQHYNLAFTLK